MYNALGQQVAVLFDGMAEASRQYDLSYIFGFFGHGYAPKLQRVLRLKLRID